LEKLKYEQWFLVAGEKGTLKSVFLKSTATAKTFPEAGFKGQKRCARQVTCPKS
jgi:hypothetical protein